MRDRADGACGNSANRYHDVVIFDGLCNLCARSVRFILNHEAAPVLRFTSLQSPLGMRLLREFEFDPADAETFVLVADGRTYVKSDAAVRLAVYLTGAWKFIGALKIIPRPVRDCMYDGVARNRYRLFGRREECMAPTSDLRARFLQE